MKKTIFCALALIVSTNVMAWSLFGPKTYEECILENMKGVSSDTAANEVKAACYLKFLNEYKPTKAEQAEAKRAEEAKKAANLARQQKAARCKVDVITTTDNDFNYELRELTLAKDAAFADKFFGRIKNAQFENGMKKISFQNNNDFGVYSLRIGFTKLKHCSVDTSAYEAIITCTGKNSVLPLSHGSLRCDLVPNYASKLGTCVIGMVPSYSGLEDQLRFLESHGLCN